MKTDHYTKVILTIIALALTVNVLKDFDVIPKAYAGTNPETLPPSSLTTNTLDVRIVDINTSDALNVALKDINTNDNLNVNIRRIETSDELDINIDEIGGAWVPNGGPIKVSN